MVYMLSGGDYEKSALLHVSLGYTVICYILQMITCIVDCALSLTQHKDKNIKMDIVRKQNNVSAY